jgi:hypothetical protein
MTDQDAVNRHSHWSHYGDLEQEDSEMTAWYHFDLAMQNNDDDANLFAWDNQLTALASSYGYATADQVISSIQDNNKFDQQNDSENFYQQHDLKNKNGINETSDYYQCVSKSIQSIKNMLSEKSLDPSGSQAKYLDEMMLSIKDTLNNGWDLRVNQVDKDRTSMLNPENVIY